VIVQHEILRHHDGLRGEDPEAEPRRRDAGQVARFREEREGLGERTRHPLPPTQRIDRLQDHAPEYIEALARLAEERLPASHRRGSRALYRAKDALLLRPDSNWLST